MNLRDFVDVTSRRKALEEELGIDLANIGTYSLHEEQASRKNCENMIGVCQVPVGVAGPLVIRNQESGTKNEFYVPLATTEGALVASVNRGCKALTESGGVTVMSRRAGITRAPVFRVENLHEADRLTKWLENNFSEIKKIAESTSSHLTLLAVKTWILGRSVFARFAFDTQDAMGMNMATIASEEIVKTVERETGSVCVAVSGNMCVDKKANYLNFIEGRGYSVWAEAYIPDIIITSVLKTEKGSLLEVAERKLHQASILSGTIGANAHMANILAAIFLATGQDIAHVTECSSGITSIESTDAGLSVSVYLPDLVVGIVGGGTSLGTQKEALSIMGGKDTMTGEIFAQRIGGAVLAGEISLLASLSAKSLGQAHKKYGRGI